MPTISVILPVYNASEFLLEALESITNQTFTDWEMIAINDGSTDNSLEILQEYAKKEPRLRIISRENRGLPRTLNEGIELAQGEYIARMDADDISLPERFEKQLECLKTNNIDLCGTQYERFGNLRGNSSNPTTIESCYFKLLFGNAFAHPTMMGKAKIFKRYKYSLKCKHAQDYELWCRMALDNVKMGNLSLVLLKYRFSNTQISTAKAERQKESALNITYHYWQNCKIIKGIEYPNYLHKKSLNQFDVIQSLNILEKMLKEKTNKFSFSLENSKTIEFEKKKLYLLLTQFNILILLSYLKRDKIISLKEKMIYSLLCIFKIYSLRNLLAKLLPKYLVCYFKSSFY